MHSCMCYHRSTCTQTVYTCIMHLSARNFSGLVGEIDPPPIKFTPPLWHGCHMTIIVLIHKVYFKNLDVWLLWLISRVQSEQSLGGSDFEGPFKVKCLQLHWRGFRNFWQFFLVVPAQAGLFVFSDLLGGIYSCFWVYDIRLLVWRCSLGVLFLPYLPMTTGDPKLLEGLLCSCKRVPVFLGILQNYRKDFSATERDAPVSLNLSFCFPCLMT